MTEKGCKHCHGGYVARWAHGQWSHSIPGGKYVCIDMGHRGDPNKLKLFMAIFSPTQGTPRIEMTILHKDQLNAEWAATAILEEQGYDTTKMKLHVAEIEGPFEAGTLISRHDG